MDWRRRSEWTREGRERDMNVLGRETEMDGWGKARKVDWHREMRGGERRVDREEGWR